MIQFIILILGAIAIWLSQHNKEYFRKWACVFGLVGQPFWIYDSYMNQQWGIFILSFVYGYCWLMGFKTYLRNEK